MPNSAAPARGRRSLGRPWRGIVAQAALITLLMPMQASGQGDVAGGDGLSPQRAVTQPVAQPLSAIDWLNEDGLPPDPSPLTPGAPLAGDLPLSEPPATNTVVTPDVTVTP
ncbi:MAG: hypothetical protein LPK02_10025, partial [Rhodobacterales bacterium]|nr:hypothetical protein [Rhodobacterales bacterium]MDX5413369.1 hypothetical protein [Rhodobacterales bacterium]